MSSQTLLEEVTVRLGLRPNEAKVYMAVLGQGKATLMNVARKAKMDHSLVDRYMKPLLEDKLVFKVKEGKKHYYYINNPRHGLRMYVRRELERVLAKQRLLDDYMEGFDMNYYGHTGLPEVKYIEGKNATRSLHLEIDNTKIGELYEFTNLDEARKFTTQKERITHKKELRVSKRKSTIIYTTEKGAILPPRWKRKKRYYIPKDHFDFPGEISVFGDKIALIAFNPKHKIVIVREQSIAKTMKALFRLALERAEEYPQPKRKTGGRKSPPPPMSSDVPTSPPVQQQNTPSKATSSFKEKLDQLRKNTCTILPFVLSLLHRMI